MVDPTFHVTSGSFVNRFDWWRALVRVLASVEAVRDGRAMYVLLASFAGGGLALACARASLGRGELYWAIGQGAGALFVAFYGSNAAGLLMMDRALGRPDREVIDVCEDALGIAHRVLASLLMVLIVASVVAAGVVGLFWLCGLAVIGPWLYALVVPLTVVVLGLGLVAGATVIAPLAGPTVWAGASSLESPRILWRLVREQLLQAAVLVAGLSVITALVGAAASAVVFAGGRIMAELSIWLLGVDVAPELFMAGLFGHSLNGAAVPGVPPEAIPYLSAATVGGGAVFALGLVLPTLVYLRGVCEIYVTLRTRMDESAR
ncbi:MAG: hypothetical protein KGL90_05205 [Burkholderiales bacterium]|nr:hypothetical protein [Burkholderiales bacterium]